MDINSLRLVSIVGAKLSLVSAATIVDLDPSTVSRKITQIENELGASLFNRNTRSVTLTSFGVRFLKHAEFILKEYDLAIENARGERNVLGGTLKITSSVAFTEQILVPLLPKFLKLHPDISVHLLPSDKNIDLARESVDVAIRLTQQVSGDYVITKLFPTKYSVFATPDYLKRVGKLDSPHRLSELDPIVYELPGFGSHWKFRNKQSPESEFLVEINGRIAVSSPSIMKKIALLGCGPAMLANWLVDEDVAAGKLINILPEYDVTPTTFDTAAWILYVNNSHVPVKIKAFISFLKFEAKKFLNYQCPEKQESKI